MCSLVLSAYLVVEVDIEYVSLLYACLKPQGAHTTHAEVVFVELSASCSFVQTPEPAAVPITTPSSTQQHPMHT